MVCAHYLTEAHTVPRREKIQMAILAALMHHKPDYRSPRKLDEAAKIITEFVEAELNK